MKYLKLVLLGLIVTCVNATAQTLGLKSSSVTKKDNKVTVKLILTTKDVNTKAWHYVLYKPVITDGEHIKVLDVVTLKRDGKQEVEYIDKTSYKDWMETAHLKITRDILNDKREPLESKENNLTYKFGAKESEAASNLSASVATMSGFTGSYIEPAEDAADKKSQSDLYLTLDEMRICESVSPELLTLRQLYQVAQSYRDENPDRFYEVIIKSYNLFPTSQDASLNAASISIERSDLQAAANYLKNAQPNTKEYNNVKGAYEIMSGNFSEGIRLLKASKLAGSTDAASNLDYFFAHYQSFANGNQ